MEDSNLPVAPSAAVRTTGLRTAFRDVDEFEFEFEFEFEL